MSNWIKQNLVLVSGIVLPVLLVVGFLLLSKAPRMLTDPPLYDFLLVAYRYEYQQPRNYYLAFEVRERRLTGRVMPLADGNPNFNRQMAGIYRYDAQQNSFEEILYELPEGVDDIEVPIPIDLSEISHLALDKRKQSPDGYTFEYLGYRGRGGLLGEIFGMGRRYESHYVLKKGSAYFDLPQPAADPYYYQHNMHFMGWVTEEADTP